MKRLNLLPNPGIGAKRNLATRSSTAEVCNPVGSGVPNVGTFFPHLSGEGC